MTAKDLVGRTSESVAAAGDVFHLYPRVTGRGLPSHCPNLLCLGAQKARVDWKRLLKQILNNDWFTQHKTKNHTGTPLALIREPLRGPMLTLVCLWESESCPLWDPDLIRHPVWIHSLLCPTSPLPHWVLLEILPSKSLEKLISQLLGW